jgi:hypothetical protein
MGGTMSYIFIEVNGIAHKDILQFIDDYIEKGKGSRGFKLYISTHDAKDFVKSVKEAMYPK